jgi:hypothetical protein
LRGGEVVHRAPIAAHGGEIERIGGLWHRIGSGAVEGTTVAAARGVVERQAAGRL